MAAMLLNKKTIERLGSQFSEVSAAKPSAFALKQMEKMGWKEGQGLGKNETGMVKHITVKKREENVALGGDKPDAVAALPEQWWHDAFSANLHAMKNKMKDKKSKKDKKDKKDKKKDREDKEYKKEEPPSFDDLFRATGGVRLGMRARADQKGKLKRTEDTGIEKLAASHVEESDKPEKKKRRKSE